MTSNHIMRHIERFKDLLVRCLQHGYQNWIKIKIYNWLNGQTWTIVDATLGDTLMSKTIDNAYSLLADIATNNFQWPNERSSAKKVDDLYEMDHITVLVAQISSITSQIAALTTQRTQTKANLTMAASIPHQEIDIENEQVQYVSR